MKFAAVLMCLLLAACGDGPASQPESPVTRLAAGGWHSLALRHDGSILAWGSNRNGRLGDASAVDSAVPKSIDGGYASVAAGGNHTLAVGIDGRLWAWGYNGAGELGDGSTSESLVPRLIGSRFSVVEAGFAHSVALDNDGRLWAWGDNFTGQLGDGTTADAHTPKLIGSGYASVAAGGAEFLIGIRPVKRVSLAHTMAIRTDGSLWTWGYNQYGQLGNGSTTGTIIPALIGTGYAGVAAGGMHSVGLRTDGTLLCVVGRNGRVGASAAACHSWRPGGP